VLVNIAILAIICNIMEYFMQLLWMLDAVGCVLIYRKGLQFMYL
jgi:hypothetical protein